MEPSSNAFRPRTVAVLTGIAALLLFAFGLAVPRIAGVTSMNDKDPAVLMLFAYFFSLALGIVALAFGVKSKRRGEGPLGLAVGAFAVALLPAAFLYLAVTG